MYKKSFYFSVLLIVSLLISCRDGDETIQSGTVQFSFSSSAGGAGRIESLEISHILISIVSQDNSVLYDREKVDVVRFGDDYLSDPISLVPGNYSLTEYLVIDSNGDVIYATPQEGSDLAYLVSDPLPINFSVSNDETTGVSVEVVSADAGSGEDFGYSTFTLEIVDFVQFQLGVFVFDINTNNYELTSASMDLYVDDVLILERMLGDSTNMILLPVGEEYAFVINKDLYDEKTIVLTFSDLEAYESDPLEIILNGNGLTTLILNPGATTGKDAGLWTEEPDLNYGNTTAFYALAWTWSGDGYDDGEWKNLIEFDMSSIPVGNEIVKATLKLSFYEDSYFADLYHQFKTNEAKLQRVLEAWDEATVTWNTQPNASTDNELLIPSTIDNPYTDYEINVTQLVKDQRLHGNYGFLFSLQHNDFYRGVVMSSSDHPESDHHPILEIVYQD